MGSDFTNFLDRCHGPVPFRGLFRGRSSGTAGESRGSSAVARLQGWIPKLDFIGLCGAGLDLGGQSQGQSAEPLAPLAADLHDRLGEEAPVILVLQAFSDELLGSHGRMPARTMWPCGTQPLRPAEVALWT